MDVQHLSNEQKACYPFCSFELQWTGGIPAQRLCQRVNISGTKEKESYFTIRHDPQAVGEYIATLSDTCNTLCTKHFTHGINNAVLVWQN